MLFYLKVLLFIAACLAIGLFLIQRALVPGMKPWLKRRVVLPIMLTPAIALLCQNAMLFYLYLIVVVAAAGRDRATVVAGFLVMLPTVPEIRQQTGVAGMYLLPVSTFLAMTVGGLIGYAKGRRTTGPGVDMYDVMMLVLVGIFASMDSRGLTALSLVRFTVFNAILYAGPYFLVSRGLKDAEQIERALLGFCVAGIACACVGIYEGTRNWVLFQNYSPALHVPLPMGSAPSIRGGHLRVPGPPTDPTAYGFMLVVFLCIMPAVRHFFRRRWYVAMLGILLFTLLMTQARGAWIGGATAWAVMALYRGRYGRATLGLVAVLFGQLALTTLVPDNSSIAQSVGRAPGVAADTADYRRQLFARGIEQVRAHPWTGQSATDIVHNFAGLEQGQHIVDFVNSHLFVAMACGIPVFLMWAGIWFGLMAKLWASRRRFRRHGLDRIGCATIGVIAAALPTLAFTSLIDRNGIWLILALALTAAATRAASRAGRATGAAPSRRPPPTLPVTGAVPA